MEQVIHTKAPNDTLSAKRLILRELSKLGVNKADLASMFNMTRMGVWKAMRHGAGVSVTTAGTTSAGSVTPTKTIPQSATGQSRRSYRRSTTNQ